MTKKTVCSTIAALLLTSCGGGPKGAAAPVDPDKDGIIGAADKCPDKIEDGVPPDDDGCPQPDFDRDGLIGLKDRCPNAAESANGVEDSDGCPESVSSVVRKPKAFITAREIKIDEKVMFAFGEATIEKKSDELLDDIASLMKANGDVNLVEVAGHADQKGTVALNLDLTRRRAAAVVDALVKRGVEPARLRSMGYGFYCTLNNGADEVSREKNRRVEFLIVQRNAKPTGVQTGCPQASAKGVVAGKK